MSTENLTTRQEIIAAFPFLKKSLQTPPRAILMRNGVILPNADERIANLGGKLLLRNILEAGRVDPIIAKVIIAGLSGPIVPAEAAVIWRTLGCSYNLKDEMQRLHHLEKVGSIRLLNDITYIQRQMRDDRYLVWKNS